MTKEQLIDKQRELQELRDAVAGARKDLAHLREDPPAIIAADLDYADFLIEMAAQSLTDAAEELNHDCK